MSQPLCFCLVANVAAEVFGHRGASAGTRHFSAGTKVYCEMPQWGDGYENIWVVGRHRGSRRLIRIIMPAKRLVNWRIQGVYSPAVNDRLRFPWPDKSTAEAFVRGSAARNTAGDVQDAGKIVTRAYRLLEAGGPVIATLEQEATAAASAFTPNDWKREPQGPASLQVLADWLKDSGAELATEALVPMLTRRARRKEERAHKWDQNKLRSED